MAWLAQLKWFVINFPILKGRVVRVCFFYRPWPIQSQIICTISFMDEKIVNIFMHDNFTFMLENIINFHA